LKYLFIPTIILLAGCSSKNLDNSFKRVNKSFKEAIKHEMTIAPLLLAGTLYSTGYDKDITNHLMTKKYFTLTSKQDDDLREINKLIMYSTILMTGETYSTKAKRVVSNYLGVKSSSYSTTLLNKYIKKETPNGNDYFAIGSNHAAEPFASSINTYENLKQSSITPWVKYPIIATNYGISSVISLSRVEDGGHSFSDQLISNSVGNFLGVFFLNLLMNQSTDLLINVDILSENKMFNLSFKY
jgi:hypothetical protein